MPHSSSSSLSHGHSHHVEPLEIHLESSELVLRGLTGEDLEPAVLNGELVLNLHDTTTLKEISLNFTGTAKVSWRDTSTHHHDFPLFYHDFAFLNPSSSSTPHPAIKHSHPHTLKAGRHVFPFSLHIPGSLPASLRTYSGACMIEYKLKAVATRSGFAAADWRAKRVVKITRGFAIDAVEYNQTLEIENTWPGKVMYAFTIPHKAYAAGETVPVSVKFSPLAKGVRIVSLVTTIREHTTVHSKSSSHSEARDATVVKYNFVSDQGTSNTSATPARPDLPHPVRVESSGPLASPALDHAAGGFSRSFSGAGRNGNAIAGSSSSGTRALPPRAHLPGEGEDPAGEEPLVDDGQDTEVDVVIEVPVPVWTCPTHNVHPCFVSHKIKWSAFIRNPDGHVSELRCALPIHILSPTLAEEAQLASAGSRNLLFGESGVLAHSDVPQVDLPSYQDHVRDRVANAETASYFSLASGFLPTPWSHRSPGVTPGPGTPGAGATPAHSPPNSRPASPHRSHSSSSSHLHHGFSGLSALSQQHRAYREGSRRSSGTATPITTPPGDGYDFDEEHPEDHRNWFDSELMNTLTLDHTSPAGSRPSSRPGSRAGSRPGSRAGSRQSSRPASPERRHSGPPTPNNGAASTLSLAAFSGGGNGGLFHLHIPKPLRPLTSFSRTGSSSSLQHASGSHSHGSSCMSSPPISTAFDHHPSASALSHALAMHAAKTQRASSSAPVETHTHAAMSNSSSTSHTPPNSASPSTLAAFPPANPAIALAGSTSASLTASSPSPVPSPLSSSHRSTHAHGLGTIGNQRHHHHHSQHHGTNHYDGEEDIEEESEPVDWLSRVPDYEVASRGFLGGGVTPISASMGLPSYDETDGSVRTTTTSSLPVLGVRVD
ncbi:BQ5605_C010g05854 [Microbotryum silenes-dioicae]|uniref:BQ5605_C010g05854 protein n=1 Tax=Microbotryum silenes-dioicae TaxID=796604 RepID=A0A2X0MJ27_9BASI|nr:BQ5605_C010g05854 [Microbotryum silenes-dioicae]